MEEYVIFSACHSCNSANIIVYNNFLKFSIRVYFYFAEAGIFAVCSTLFVNVTYQSTIYRS